MDEQTRIQVTEAGPYILHCDVPVIEMAPVHTFNGEPIAWHTVRDLQPTQTPVKLCRCGQSSTKPFCDESHLRIGFVGTETADRRPFSETATVERSSEASFADNGAFCVSAGFCGTRTTDVWKLLEEANDPDQFHRMRGMIWQCPSGRLVLRAPDGTDLEPPLAPEIAVIPGGPIWIRGGIPVVGADGHPWEPRNRMTLCRCGESSNKPFCDGSHQTLHFDER